MISGRNKNTAINESQDIDDKKARNQLVAAGKGS